LTAVNNILGSDYDDILIGNLENNILDGGAGNDIIKGVGGNNTIIGGAGNDSFVFLDNAKLDGSIDGKAGQDTLDFSAYETARNIVLTVVEEDGFSGSEAALTGGFTNIDNIIGSSAGGDRLTGINAPSIFRLGTGQDTAIPEYESGGKILTFSGIENLYGGSGDDIFEIRGKQTYNLFGGAGDNTFKFIGAAELNGTIDGGSGVNTLDYSKYNLGDNSGVEVNLATGQASGVSGGVQNISNLIGSDYNDTLIGDDRDNVIKGGKGDDHLEGRDGYNTYIFEEGWGQDTVINSSGQGMLDLSALGADWHLVIDLTAKTIIVDSGLPEIANNGINFDGISHIRSGSGNDEFIISDRQKMDLAGGGGDDTFKFVGTGVLEGIIDGGGGYNTLDFSQYGTVVNFDLEAMNVTSLNGVILKGFTNIHKLVGSSHGDTIRGANADSRYAITAENEGRITWSISLGGQVIEYSFDFEGIENLIGGSGNDTFAIIGQGCLTGFIDGGAGSNTLDYSCYDNGDNTGVKVDLSQDNRSATAIGGGERSIPNDYRLDYYFGLQSRIAGGWNYYIPLFNRSKTSKFKW
jgi:Ca2+-binding RTX toxin-like protein